MKRHFVSNYFSGKDLVGLKKTITPDWSDENVGYHLNIVDAPPEAKHILEIGCGIGRLLIPLYDRGAEFCAGVDASPDMIGEGLKLVGSRNIDFCLIGGNGYLPYGPDQFDFVFSIITFQHIPNTATVKRYLTDAYRVLRPGGSLMFQVLSHDVHPGRELWTYHDLEELKAHLMSVGFDAPVVVRKGVWAIFKARKE